SAQRAMIMVLPIVFVPIWLRFPSGLMIYWVTTNLWTTGQGLVSRKLIPRPTPPPKRTSRTPPEEAVASKEPAAAPSSSRPVRTGPPRRVKKKRGGGGCGTRGRRHGHACRSGPRAADRQARSDDRRDSVPRERGLAHGGRRARDRRRCCGLPRPKNSVARCRRAPFCPAGREHGNPR